MKVSAHNSAYLLYPPWIQEVASCNVSPRIHVATCQPSLIDASFPILTRIHVDSFFSNSHCGSVTVNLGVVNRGVHPSEAMMHFPSVSDFPLFLENFTNVTFSEKILVFHPPTFLKTFF